MSCEGGKVHEGSEMARWERWENSEVAQSVGGVGR